MKCPYCGKEMEKGKVSLMTLQGMSHMVLSYLPDSEADKSIFKQNTKDITVSPAADHEAYYCDVCKKIISVFDAE